MNAEKHAKLEKQVDFIFQDDPKDFYNDLVATVEEFDKNFSELRHNDPQTFYILLLGTMYKLGYDKGKAAK